jgi:membrane-bound metal-dependent hydrolase YbcI (DUF457 family)
MDIVTHAGIALIAAMPFMHSRPEFALGILAGSVLPDLDALSRIFGKLAFLRSHQTWSHALAVQALASGALGGLAMLWGLDGLGAALGMFAGLAVHTLLDWSNTLGVMLLAPFSRHRFRLEWVFFIDAFVLAATALGVTASFMEFQGKGRVSGRTATLYFSTMGIYFLAKGGLRRKAGQSVPEALSLVPSALVPWRFFGTIQTGDTIALFQVNALTGHRQDLGSHVVLDRDYAGLQNESPEFRMMRELSPAYHVVGAVAEGDGQRIQCRDLRTRNFSSTFGDLEVVLDGAGKVKRTDFHV